MPTGLYTSHDVQGTSVLRTELVPKHEYKKFQEIQIQKLNLTEAQAYGKATSSDQKT